MPSNEQRKSYNHTKASATFNEDTPIATIMVYLSQFKQDWIPYHLLTRRRLVRLCNSIHNDRRWRGSDSLWTIVHPISEP